MTKIRKTIDTDLFEIMRWLKNEYDMDDGGFYGNRGLIEEGHNEGDLFALIDDDDDPPIAFLLDGRVRPDILEVKPSRRGEGHGRKLAEFMIDLWRKKDACVIEIECSPLTSMPFWQNMGFDIYRSNRARLFLAKTYDVSPNLPKVPVRISFFPEKAMWDDDVEPYFVETPSASVTSDIIISLSRRVFGFTPEHVRGDPVVLIEVSGQEIYRNKARYDGAVALGVKRDTFGFFVDQLELPNLAPMGQPPAM